MLPSNKINIAFVSHFPHYKMGGQKSMINLICNLDRNYFHPIVILPNKGSLSKKMDELDVQNEIINLTSFKPKHLFSIIKNIFSLRRIIKNYSIDILHPDLEADTLLCGITKLITKVKLVWHVRLTRPTTSDAILFRLSDKVIGVSDACFNRFQNFRNKEKYQTIYNGVDCSVFNIPVDNSALRKNLNLPSDKIIVGFVGQIIESKGVFDFINTIKILELQNPNHNFIFLIIGDSNDNEFYRNIIKLTLPIQSIKLIPFTDDIHLWMQSFDILVLPSHEGSEGMGRVIFEAMATGTVCIGTNISGIKEAISINDGFLVNEKSPKEIADTLIYITQHNEKMQQMKKSARMKALEQFDIQIHAKKVMNLYKEISRY